MKNEIYCVDGISNDFLSWCKQFNQKPEIVRSRMSLGYTLDEALHLSSNNKELLFSINGEVRTLQHWCRIYCINAGTVINRIYQGYPHEDAITQPPKKPGSKTRRYIVNGEEYVLSELSIKFKLNQSTIMSRLRAGETIYEALDIISSNRKSKRRKDNLLGQYALYTHEEETKTLFEWAREKEINMVTLKARLKNGYSFEEAISANDYIGAYKYDIDNQQLTLKEIEKKYGINARLVYRRIYDGGYSVYDAIHTVNEPNYYLFEDEYLTVPQISERTGIKKITLYSRLQKGLSIEAATSTPVIKRGTLYDVRGEQLSLVQISEKYDIPYSRLYRKIVTENIPIEQALITKEVKKSSAVAGVS